jgi:hypothetical protein
MRAFSKKEIRAYLRGQLNGYESTVGDMAERERTGLHKWVSDGNSVYENPCLYSGGNGCPMDYISAVRLGEEMTAHPERFRWSGEKGGKEPHAGDEPF